RVTELNSASPVLIDVTHAGIGAASRAFEAAFGAAPLLQREGATVPVTIDFQEALHTGLIVTGFGLPGDGLHSPNERFSLDQYHRGTEMVIRLCSELAEVHARA
ncbi:MAG: M20/M25/M40 family metallo-hydrolase, partial [Candidatus Dormibacteraeota bacterium]|nr:M20/M25/M40 family metallo-hydrolase [Candidatus Dormibacteraeota bacterium]